MVVVEDLRKSYGTFEAVKGVSFSVSGGEAGGEIVGLLGPNGAGKTTIIKILTCYHYPTSGRASVDSLDVYEDALAIKKRVGYLPENAPVYQDLTVAEYLDFIANARNLAGGLKKERTDWAVHECGLEKMYYRGIDTLSKGYRQRVGLAQAIIHDPEILILDEPTTGLDPNQIIEIRELIRRLGEKKTVILSTHILQEVEAVCSRVLILNEGRIAAQGTVEEITKGMKGEVLFHATLKGADADSLKAGLPEIPGFRKLLSATAAGAGAVSVKFSMDPVDDGGERIFDWAVGRRLKLLELAQERFSLEDIFVKLTHEGDGK
jgi:ABC-2 type transport system ATP-binding protein